MIVYFKIKMKKNLVKLSLMLIVAFCPCFLYLAKKINHPQSIIEMAIGEYELVDVHWEGLPLDLDNDGVARYALLHEYKNLLGYFETNHIAIVGYKKSTEIKVEAQLAFPEYIEKNGDFKIRGLKYIPMSIGLENIDSPSSYQTIQFKNYDKADADLSDIYSVTALSFADNSFKLKLHCTLLHVDISDNSQDLETNYLVYTYRKKK